MKKMIIALSLIFFAAAASAQPLKNFQYDESLEISQSGSFQITGGETAEANVTFDNIAGTDIPLVVEFEVSSENMEVTGEEFELDATSYSSVSGASRDTNLSCSSTRTSDSSAVWKCLNSTQNEILGSETGTPSTTTVNLEATAAPNIAPGNYSFELRILSQVGAGGPTVNKSVNASSPAKVSTPGGQSVKVEASSDANVTVQELDQVSTPSPTGDSFAGGVSVDVSNSSGEVAASGTVTINYGSDTYDSREVSVWYYNDTGQTNEWQEIGGTQYPSNNTVSAEVSHFSTYGAFVQRTSTDSSDSGDSTIENYYPRPDQNDTEQNQTEQNETNLGQQETQGTDEQDAQQESTEQQGQEETGPQQTSSPETPAGQFFSNTTSVAALLAVLLAALAAILQHSGRVDFAEYLPLQR